MSDEQDELERQLAAMYGSIRPRAGFEPELWSRLEAQRPWYRRLGALRGPAFVLAPALAVLLLAGAFVVLLTHTGFHGGTGCGGAATSSQVFATPAFGKLPAPPGATLSPASKSAVAYSGAVPALPASAPVYRQPLTSETQLAIAAPGTQATSSDPVVAAKDFLARNSALPSYPYVIFIDGSDVVFSRQFQVGAEQARLVMADGRPYGIRVTLQNGQPTRASGPVDQPLAEAAYPLRSAGQVLQPPAPPGDQYSAALNSVEVVYVVVPAGGFVYYEPALLFTSGGITRTLQPAVAPQFLQQ